MTTLLIILLVIALIGFPWGGYHTYGYGPSGLIGVVLLVLVLLILFGQISL